MRSSYLCDGYSYSGKTVIISLRPSDAYICVSKLTIIGSENGLSHGRRQAIIWTSDGILSIRTFRTHFSEIVRKIHTFSFKKMHIKMSPGKWRPSCLSLNVLKWHSFLAMPPKNFLKSWKDVRLYIHPLCGYCFLPVVAFCNIREIFINDLDAIY